MEVTFKITDKAVKFFTEKATKEGITVPQAVSLVVEGAANENQPIDPKQVPELMRLKNFLDNHYHDPSCRHLAFILKYFVEGKPIPKPQARPNPIVNPEPNLFEMA